MPFYAAFIASSGSDDVSIRNALNDLRDNNNLKDHEINAYEITHAISGPSTGYIVSIHSL